MLRHRYHVLNWQSFQRVNENKAELFQFLGKQAESIQSGDKEVYITFAEQVLTSSVREDKSRIEPNSHEEADSIIVLHVADAVEKGHHRIMV